MKGIQKKLYIHPEYVRKHQRNSIFYEFVFFIFGFLKYSEETVFFSRLVPKTSFLLILFKYKIIE